MQLLADWEDFKRMASKISYFTEILYKVEKETGEDGRRKTVYKISCGNFGIVLEFDDERDADEIEEVERWLANRDAVRVVGSVSKEFFFA